MARTRIQVSDQGLMRAVASNAQSRAMMAHIGGQIVANAKRKSPSNRVKKEIEYRVGTTTNGLPRLVVNAGRDQRSPGFFAPFLELGTANHTPKPFLRPAAQDVLRPFKATWKERK